MIAHLQLDSPEIVHLQLYSPVIVHLQLDSPVIVHLEAGVLHVVGLLLQVDSVGVTSRLQYFSSKFLILTLL